MRNQNKMEKEFKKILDEWLFQKEKTFNPFLRFLAESVREWPKVREVEKEQNEKDN